MSKQYSLEQHAPLPIVLTERRIVDSDIYLGLVVLSKVSAECLSDGQRASKGMRSSGRNVRRGAGRVKKVPGRQSRVSQVLADMMPTSRPIWLPSFT